MSKSEYLGMKYGGKWTYDHHSGWYCDDGRYVRRCASWAPRYDGDDDTTITQYWLYGEGTPRTVTFTELEGSKCLSLHALLPKHSLSLQ